MRAGWVAGLVVALTACGPGGSGTDRSTAATGGGQTTTGGSDAGTPPPPLQQVRVSVAPASTGHGRVTSSPAGIDCPGACITTVDVGTAMTLTAKADDGSLFGGWGGGCSGPGVCNLVANADVTVWVDFEPNTPPPAAMSCDGLTPATPGKAVTASIDHYQRCEPGLGDATGTIGLRNRIGDTMSSAQQRNFYFYDGVSGSQKSFTSAPGLDGSDDAYVAQLSGFVQVVNVPQLLSTQVVDKDGKKTDASDAMAAGKGVVARAGFAGNGLLLAGPFVTPTTGDPKVAIPHELCFFADGAHATWCRDLGDATVLGLGMDAKNRTLVIVAGEGTGSIDGLWFDADGKPLADRFAVLTGFTPADDTWFETAPLIGGDLAVRSVDRHTDVVGDFRTSHWVVVVKSGSTSLSAPPAWLQGRDNTDLAIVRSGKAYALLPLGAPDADCAQKIDVLAPDGTACGSMDVSAGQGKCRTADVAVSLDGTPIQVMPKTDPAAYTCSWRWWPGALR